MVLRYVLVSIGSGVLFGLVDGVIHANPLARRLYEVFSPIARTSINVPVGLAIDLIYGFALAGGFLLLEGSLPGTSGAVHGLVYGGLIWFARVAMQVASQWMMFKVPCKALLYTLVTGLAEMLLLGLLYGLVLG
ncbi:MAG: hypothetical protein JSW65_00175 [Candidatus Bipolaricaulota bacterium]|nr:MAG: hypothetical protein JSW65_00175 [Candidatus Bipolaricaulota bacterium]